jgi:hypothetical protein
MNLTHYFVPGIIEGRLKDPYQSVDWHATSGAGRLG